MDDNTNSELLLPGMTNQNTSPGQSNTSQGAEGGTETKSNQQLAFSSPDEVAKLVNDLIKPTLDENFRAVQSMVDTKLSTQNKRVQNAMAAAEKRIDDLKAMGVDLTAQQAQQIKDQEIQAAQQSPAGDSDEAQDPSQDQPSGTAPVVNHELEFQKLKARYPFGILDTDAEATNFNLLNESDPAEFLKRYELALAAKATRLSLPGGGNAGTALGGLGSGGHGNPLQNVKDVNALTEIAADEIRKKMR